MTRFENHTRAPLGWLALAAALAGAGIVQAQQQSILFSLDYHRNTAHNANGRVAAGLILEDEVAVVRPQTNTPYSGSVFLSVGAQWAFIGDMDADNRLVDDPYEGPGDHTNAILVKRFNGSGQFGPRDVFVSKEGYDGLGRNVEDGNVFRYADQGRVVSFVTEDQLLGAIGQAANSDLDVDAICQDTNGNVYLSFETNEDVNGTVAEDGAIVYIPRSAIVYNFAWNVASITPASAQIVASETDLRTWAYDSGLVTSHGGRAYLQDTTALEIDPAGGTWTSPQVPGLVLPNLLYAWNGTTNDGAIVSTAGAGTITRINGVEMGSQTMTTGEHLGMLPGAGGMGGLMALGLTPAQAQPPLVLENYPVNLVSTTTTLWTQQQVSGATPNGVVFFVVDVAGGSIFPITTVPFLRGQIFGIGLLTVIGSTTADAYGYASNTFVLPASLRGSNHCWAFQVVDVGRLSFGLPAALQVQ